ncbi:S8 family serine peptidase [Actinophytocola sediminis]
MFSTMQASAAPGGSAEAARSGGTTVTLVTGDQVTLIGERGVSVKPGHNRENVTFTRSTLGGHVHVVPNDAKKLVATGQLDRRLFDITTLIEFGYDDARRDTVPLIVTHAAGAAAPRLAGTVRALPSVDGVAVAAAKDTTTWEALTDGIGVRTAASGVRRVWLNGKRQAVLDRSAAQIGAPAAWESGLTGEGVRVAVLDTGVDQTHPDLADREIAEQNFSASPDNVDNAGHGTHVASIVAGTGAKYRGIASGAEILDGKVLDDTGFGLDSEIIAGMEWAAEQDADIINMSLGGRDTPEVDPLEQAVESLTAEHDVLFVIAAGNGPRNSDPVASPGSVPAALTVGAVDRDDLLAPFSLTGPTVGDAGIKPDLTAPGVDIVAALHAAGTIGPPVDEGYTALSGTSMAAPHVAGAAALLAQQHPDWPGQRLKAALAGSAVPTPELTVFEQGSGRVDLARAIDATVVAEPSSLSLGIQPWPREDDEPVTRTLTYRNLGDTDSTHTLSLAATDPNGDPTDVFSLSANEITVPAGGTAEVTVTGDPRSGPADGAYSGVVVATAGDAVIRTPVGITREEESYDLTLNFTEDPANPADLYLVTAVGLTEYTWHQAVVVDGSVTLRLPAGPYLLDFEALTEDGTSYAKIVRPGVVLDRDQTIEVDFADAKPISVTPPQGVTLGLAEIMYQHGSGDTALVSGLLSGDLTGMRTAQLGDPLPDQEFAAWLNGDWWGAGGELYALIWFLDRYPAGFTKVVRQEELATVHADLGPNALSDFAIHYWQPQPASGSLWAGVSGNQITLPESTTTYVTTEGVRWEPSLWVYLDGYYPVATFTAPLRALRAGRTYRDRFNHPVFGPGLPAASTPWAYRSADEVVADIPLFTDGAGNAGFTDTESGSTKLYRGEELLGESPQAGGGVFAGLPAADGDYRLTTEATRAAAFDLTTSISAEWTFRSSHVDGERALPLNTVRFLPRLDAAGAAPAGRPALVPVQVRDERGVLDHPVRLTVEASYDEGTSWHRVPVSSRQVAVLEHPAGATSVSLRASAADRDGNTVDQTMIRAYKLT